MKKKITKKINNIINALKRIKLSTLIILIVLLSFNTYAWFIYATKVSSGISAHISSWNIHFKAGEEMVTTGVVFDVENLYPGMETETKTVTAYNMGEMVAELSYKIAFIRILDTTYIPSETFSQEQMLEEITANWPFELTFSIDNANLQEENGSADFVISLAWPYDSGHDEQDTRLGKMAYNYSQRNPGTPSMHIELEVQAVQNTTDTNE